MGYMGFFIIWKVNFLLIKMSEIKFPFKAKI